jgi:hypothetical protein
MWYWVRIGLLVAFFAMGIVFPYNDFRIDVFAAAVPGGIPVLVIGMCIFAILFPPLALIFVIGIQAVNPYSAPRWTKPSWRSNFLNLRDMLHFFHFGAFAGLAGAAGSALGSLAVQGRLDFVVAVMQALASLGFLAGVRLCMRVYRFKYQDKPPQAK